MTSRNSPNKKTFEEQHNITLTKQTYMRDQLELNPQNWIYLYQEMKSRGLNLKEIRQNISKYDQNVLSLVQNSQNFTLDKIHNFRLSIKQKITQYNTQLRIRLSELFQYIAMLHLQELSTGVEFMYDSLVGTVAQMVDSIEQLKQSNYRLQKELEDWKLRKKNVLCFSCKQNVEEAKLRNLYCEMSQTISEQVPTDHIDHHHKINILSSQCKTIEMQLSAMSQENFFNQQSESLIELINEALKTRIFLGNNRVEQNTSAVLTKCLNEMNEMTKPFELDYVPLESAKDIQSGKRIGSASVLRALSVKDLADIELFFNKLKTVFSEPIHRFIDKSIKIIHSKTQSSALNNSLERKQQQTQTSILKQPDLLKNYEKLMASMSKELTILKSSKQKNDKEVLRVLDLLQKNESKMIDTIARNRLLQIQNAELHTANMTLKQKVAQLEKQAETQKQTLLRNFTSEKANLLKQLTALDDEVRQFKQQNLEKAMRLKFQIKGVQTFNTAFFQMKNYSETEVQTEFVAISNSVITKKSMIKTLKSIQLISKATNELDQGDDRFSMISRGTAFGMKKQHTKSRSEIPTTLGRNLTSLKRFPRDQNQKMMVSRADIKMQIASLGQNIQPMKDAKISAQSRQQNIKKINMRKKRRPSINSIIPESRENTKSYLTSSKFSQQKDVSRLEKELSINNQTQPYDKMFAETLRQSLSKTGMHISGLTHKYQRSNLSVNTEGKSGRAEEDHKLAHNFSDISNFLSSTVDGGGMMVSKLKKMPKCFGKELMRGEITSKKKVVINSGLETPGQYTQEDDDKMAIQLIDSPINLRGSSLSNRQEISSHGVQVNLDSFNWWQSVNEQHAVKDIEGERKKREIMEKISHRFEYLQKIGLIGLFEQVSQTIQQDISLRNQQAIDHIDPTSQFLNDNIQIHPDTKCHIHKGDLQLFFSLEQASKYQNQTGLWSELESCIMVDTNFSKLIQQVDKYFGYLKQNNRSMYNQFFLFLQQPFKFMREVLNEKNPLLQRQKVVKEMARWEKQNDGESKDTVRDTFRKLIRLHKAVHKKGCQHVQNFLARIGFYQFSKNPSDIRVKTSPKLPKTSTSPSRVINTRRER